MYLQYRRPVYLSPFPKCLEGVLYHVHLSAGNGAVISGADVRLDFSRCSGGAPIECELRLRRNYYTAEAPIYICTAAAQN